MINLNLYNESISVMSDLSRYNLLSSSWSHNVDAEVIAANE